MKPVRGNLQQQLVESLGEQIIDGTYTTSLPTASDISESYGVSRTVTREAIKVLEEKGLLESRPKAGIQVRPREDWNLLDNDVMKWLYNSKENAAFWRDLMEMRLMIEPMAARLAAERATGEQAQAIHEAYQRLMKSVNDLGAYKAADREFHEAIFAASQNALLIYLARTINIDLDAGRDLTGTIERSLTESLPIHEQLCGAILAKNAERAQQHAERLVLQITAFIQEAITNKGT